jgi:3-hydroxyisobutyrate dehydrogenase
MGAGMARSLRRDGHEVVAWNRTRAKAEPLADDGIAIAESVRAAVDGADAALTVLFDLDAVISIRGELVDALSDDAVWIQSATVGPEGARRLAEGCERMLDAPVLGTKQPAEHGALCVLVSGPAALIERASPAFDAIGSKTVLAGKLIGQASALKLACNAWLAVLTAGTAQSLVLTERLGVDPQRFLDAIDGQPVGAPYAAIKGGLMLQQTYPPSFALDGLLKDIGLMQQAAKPVEFDAGLLDALAELFAKASEAGHGADDIAAVRYAFDG